MSLLLWIKFTNSSNPQPIDNWYAIKYFFCYLCGMPHHDLHITLASILTIHVYSDADWPRCADDMHSTSSLCIYLGNTLCLSKCREVTYHFSIKNQS
jgi:hypothetical protein